MISEFIEKNCQTSFEVWQRFSCISIRAPAWFPDRGTKEHACGKHPYKRQLLFWEKMV